MKRYPESELIINGDGTIFHLHLTPDQISDKIILVGDPGRVALVASFFDSIEFEVQSREFCTITGTYKGKRLTVLSHGIGTDNIDIVVNELDALANINFATREDNAEFKQLTMVRIGTSGGLQTHVPVGTFVISEKSLGFDGVLNFYAGREKVVDQEFEDAFVAQTGYSKLWAAPYVVDSDSDLVERIGKGEMVRGVTISANGFYGPQGRELRLPLADPNLNEKIEKFSFNGRCVTNYEMESSALQGLAKMMGHKAMTVCAIIANRLVKTANANYKDSIKVLIETVLDRI
ncbi:MAG: nucleoside phosphorylase [Bacteroidales bacterium]